MLPWSLILVREIDGKVQQKQPKRMPTVISAMQKTKHYDMTDNEGAGRDNIR